ncbi:helix-turn-helix domain-containing protein [Anaerostipes hadrus]|uniref:AlbA family DNA-binding domain-containing protein n=1 Tax=Anaerostipes hadrus TaxID=649756 RepID=UPI0005D19073|nr:ATP-binding protein [Anaerostipes hadrus]CUO73406.1 Divergent AAA domain [Anaerostipes hadrus]
MKNKLFSGESINIEYKVEMPKKSEKYMKTVVAFANGRGGRIVFGVDDKTLNIVGMNPDTIFRQWMLLQMLFQIAVSLKFIQM